MPTVKNPITRTTPAFHVWVPPVPASGHPIYSNRNARIIARQQIDQLFVSAPGSPTQQDSTGAINMRLQARRIAEWFEFQGFVRGQGTGPDGDYEGCATVVGIGDTHIVLLAGDPPTVAYVPPTGMPVLMMNSKDSVYPLDPTKGAGTGDGQGSNGPNCWYNANGVAEVYEWVDQFMAILKDELDSRNPSPLCYPSCFAFDLEYAVPQLWAAVNQDPGAQTQGKGWWYWALEDARFDMEVLNQAGDTMADIAATAPVTPPSPFISYHQGTNQAFSNWMSGQSVSIVSYAMDRAIYDRVRHYFPDAKVSNYQHFIASDAATPFWVAIAPSSWHNYNVAQITEDTSAPALYGPGTPFSSNNRKFVFESDDDFWRRFTYHEIEALRRSANAKPITPWIGAAGSTIPDYVVSDRNFQWVLRVLGRAGAVEFLLFTQYSGGDPAGFLKHLSDQIDVYSATVYSPRRRVSSAPRWSWKTRA